MAAPREGAQFAAERRAAWISALAAGCGRHERHPKVEVGQWQEDGEDGTDGGVVRADHRVDARVLDALDAAAGRRGAGHHAGTLVAEGGEVWRVRGAVRGAARAEGASGQWERSGEGLEAGPTRCLQGDGGAITLRRSWSGRARGQCTTARAACPPRHRRHEAPPRRPTSGRAAASTCTKAGSRAPRPPTSQ